MLTIAIIGGGFSGTVLAYHLYQYANKPVKVFIIERNSRLQHHVAHSADFFAHLLQMPAGAMSINADNADDFVHWIDNNDRQIKHMPANTDLRQTYFPRKYFEEYLKYTQARLMHNHKPGFEVELVFADVNDIETSSKNCCITLSTDKELFTDVVVLAMGTPLPIPMQIKNLPQDSKQYIHDPRNVKAFTQLKKKDTILIIGSGLSMLDTMISLASQGHMGNIIVLSRAGFNQHLHAATKEQKIAIKEYSVILQQLFGKILMHYKKYNPLLYSKLRKMAPHLDALWRDLHYNEKQVLITFVRQYWQSVLQVNSDYLVQILESIVLRNKLRIKVGRVVQSEYQHGMITVEYKSELTGKKNKTIDADVIINCSGISSSFDVMTQGLTKTLLDKEMIQMDRLGIHTNKHRAVIDMHSHVSTSIYALGMTTKGTLFDIVTVPQMREQCRQLAKHLLR